MEYLNNLDWSIIYTFIFTALGVFISFYGIFLLLNFLILPSIPAAENKNKKGETKVKFTYKVKKIIWNIIIKLKNKRAKPAEDVIIYY